MAQIKFGGQHTEVKLQVLQKYLESYTTALKFQKFETVFFDAFAGTGEIPYADQSADLLATEDLGSFIRGSARRALSVGTPFSKYVFVEQSSQKIEELRRLGDEFPHLASRMQFEQGDANRQIHQFCQSTNWRNTRAVIFLDPFGNQVKWKTVEEIAATKAIDLWYLFPAGLGVHRQIGKDGRIHSTHELSLDDLLGTPDWRKSFVRTTNEIDLFGMADKVEKVATPKSITEFMIDRMKTPFGSRVTDRWLPLGSRNVHMYSLIFACANPAEKAWRLANTLATAVMKA
jgi:three-Cys-motif partner protein